MKKIFVLISLLTCAAFAMTQPKWVQVSVTHDSNTTSIDTAHIIISERTATVWVLTKLSKPKYVNYNIKSHSVIADGVVVSDSVNKNSLSGVTTIAQIDGDNSSYSYNMSRSQNSYNCLNRWATKLSEIRYLNDDVVNTSTYYGNWQTIIPGTVGANIYNIVCPDDSASYKQNKIVEQPTNKNEIKSNAYPTLILPILLFAFGAFSAIYLTIQNVH